jgi:hypothetical protein
MPSSPSTVRKRATPIDVAALAGVDVSTVSRVLCGDQTRRVHQDTRECILSKPNNRTYATSTPSRNNSRSHNVHRQRIRIAIRIGPFEASCIPHAVEHVGHRQYLHVDE